MASQHDSTATATAVPIATAAATQGRNFQDIITQMRNEARHYSWDEKGALFSAFVSGESGRMRSSTRKLQRWLSEKKKYFHTKDYVDDKNIRFVRQWIRDEFDPAEYIKDGERGGFLCSLIRCQIETRDTKERKAANKTAEEAAGIFKKEKKKESRVKKGQKLAAEVTMLGGGNDAEGRRRFNQRMRNDKTSKRKRDAEEMKKHPDKVAAFTKFRWGTKEGRSWNLAMTAAPLNTAISGSDDSTSNEKLRLVAPDAYKTFKYICTKKGVKNIKVTFKTPEGVTLQQFARYSIPQDGDDPTQRRITALNVVAADLKGDEELSGSVTGYFEDQLADGRSDFFVQTNNETIRLRRLLPDEWKKFSGWRDHSMGQYAAAEPDIYVRAAACYKIRDDGALSTFEWCYNNVRYVAMVQSMGNVTYAQVEERMNRNPFADGIAAAAAAAEVAAEQRKHDRMAQEAVRQRQALNASSRRHTQDAAQRERQRERQKRQFVREQEGKARRERRAEAEKRRAATQKRLDALREQTQSINTFWSKKAGEVGIASTAEMCDYFDQIAARVDGIGSVGVTFDPQNYRVPQPAAAGGFCGGCGNSRNAGKAFCTQCGEKYD